MSPRSSFEDFVFLVEGQGEVLTTEGMLEEERDVRRKIRAKSEGVLLFPHLFHREHVFCVLTFNLFWPPVYTFRYYMCMHQLGSHRKRVNTGVIHFLV